MGLKKALTTRWQRLRHGASTLAAEADAAAGKAAAASGSAAAQGEERAASETVEPFAASVGEPAVGLFPAGAAGVGGVGGDFGLENLVMQAWQAFFTRFREDEREFELPHYLEAAAAVKDRLDRLGPEARPDLITCRMMLDLLVRFEASRFRDFNDRLVELMTSCQQLRAQLDVSELSKCYQEDELLSSHRILTAELAKRGVTVTDGPDGLPARVQDMLKQLIASCAAPVAAAPAAAAPASSSPRRTDTDLAAQVDIHARDSLDWTKLHSAAFLGRIELVELLIGKGADVNAKAKDGSTPLHLAAKKGHIKVAKFLFAKGANLAAKDNDGNTALHLAADMFTPDTIQALVTMGAYVNVKNNDGWTPLHLAANRGKQEVLDLILSLGADINAKAGNGWTPLKVAVNSGHLQVSEFLRQRGGNQ